MESVEGSVGTHEPDWVVRTHSPMISVCDVSLAVVPLNEKVDDLAKIRSTVTIVVSFTWNVKFVSVTVQVAERICAVEPSLEQLLTTESARIVMRLSMEW